MRQERTGFRGVGLLRAAPALLMLAGIVTTAVVTGCRREMSAADKALMEVGATPKSAKAYLALGDAYSDADSYNDAFAAYSEAHRLAPNDARPAYELAKADFHLANSEHGIKMAKAAIAADPKYAKAYEILGRHLMLTRKPKEAAKELKTALKHDPKLLVARLNLVAAYAVLKQPKNALKAAKEAVEVAPKEASAHYTYADLLEKQGNEKLAEKHFRQAMKIDPKHSTAMLRLALMFAEGGRNLEEARSLAKQSQEIDAGDGTAAAASAWALFQLGKRTDALRELQICTRANPYNYRIWLLFSRALKAEGYDEASQSALTTALQVAPRPPMTPKQRESLSKAYKESQKEGGKPIDPEVILGKKPPPKKPPVPDMTETKGKASRRETE